MNILQMEDTIKGLSDEGLMGEAQQPTGQVPQYLVISEVQRRADMRNRYQQQQQEQPQGTVADQVIQRGIAGVAPPPPEVGQAMYGGPPQAMYGGPPQAMNGGPPQAMYGGGVVRMKDLGGVPYSDAWPGGPTRQEIQDQIETALNLGASTDEIEALIGSEAMREFTGQASSASRVLPRSFEVLERAGLGDKGVGLSDSEYDSRYPRSSFNQTAGPAAVNSSNEQNIAGFPDPASQGRGRADWAQAAAAVTPVTERRSSRIEAAGPASQEPPRYVAAASENAGLPAWPSSSSSEDLRFIQQNLGDEAASIPETSELVELGSELWEWAKENPVDAVSVGLIFVPGTGLIASLGLKALQLAIKASPRLWRSFKASRLFTRPGPKVVLDKAGNPHRVGTPRARAVQAGKNPPPAQVPPGTPREFSPSRTLATLGAAGLAGSQLFGGADEADPAEANVVAGWPGYGAAAVDAASKRRGNLAALEPRQDADETEPLGSMRDQAMDLIRKLQARRPVTSDYTSLIAASETREREGMSGMQRLAEGLAIAQLGAGIAAGDLPGGLSKAAEIAGETKKEGFLVRREEELIRDTYKLRIAEASSVEEKEAWARDLKVVTALSEFSRAESVSQNERSRVFREIINKMDQGMISEMFVEFQGKHPGKTGPEQIRLFMDEISKSAGSSSGGGGAASGRFKQTVVTGQ